MSTIYMQQTFAVASVDCAITPNQTQGFWNLEKKTMYLSPFAWSNIPKKIKSEPRCRDVFTHNLLAKKKKKKAKHT